MTPLERRTVAVLALVYALRMVGMFMVLPVLALHTRTFEVPATALQIGLAIGIYGLAQAALQMPLGWLSDRIGRRPVVVMGLLVFAAGSFIAGSAHSVEGLLLGRLVQGLGAVSAAVSAWLADATRVEVRTTAMAILGAGMGVAFILALALGPVVAGLIGVNGIFVMTGVAAMLAVPLVMRAVPVVPLGAPTKGGLAKVWRDAELMRFNGGIFLLHGTMAMLFIGLPLVLVDRVGLPQDQHWQVYLPVLMLSIIPVFPLIRWAEHEGRMRRVFVAAVALLAATLGLLALGQTRFSAIVLGLLLFFVAFNFLEGALPSLISRQAPAAFKGAALGVYASSQFLGGFVGGVIGGIALGWGGTVAVFAGAAALPLLWLGLAWGMRAPEVASRTR